MKRRTPNRTVYSKVSTNGRTVLPGAVRESLGLEHGDTVRYRLAGGSVVIEKALAADNPFALFSEWSSKVDEAAYADL